MALHESDCEDILREATALVERAELTVPGEAEPVVIGFREGEAGSIFFGGDPVYQFNAAGKLRRAYADGLLYKAEKGRLVELRRERTQDETQLVRRTLTDKQQAEFVAAVEQKLGDIDAALAAGQVEMTRQVPAAADLAARIRSWLRLVRSPVCIAQRPHVH